MSRFLDRAGRSPRLWVVCGRTRVAAVTADQIPRVVSEWSAGLVIRDGAVWQTFANAEARHVATVALDCERHGRGSHPVDGAALVALVDQGRTRVDVADVPPRPHVG